MRLLEPLNECSFRATGVVNDATPVAVQGFKGSIVQGFLEVLWFEVGIGVAVGAAMGAKDFTELIAWQRADALEQFALEMIKRQPVADDQTFCQQTIDCASSAPRNIAEGHGRFAPVQFANFLRIAIGSEQETRNQIIKAWQRGAITDDEKQEGLILSKRALAAAVRLRHYLQSQQAKANARGIEERSNQRTNEPKNQRTKVNP